MMTLKHRWCSFGILGTWVEPVLRGPRKRSGDRLIGENTRLLTFVAIRRDIRNVATRAVAVRKCCQCDSHTVGLPTEVVPGKLLVVRIGLSTASVRYSAVLLIRNQPRTCRARGVKKTPPNCQCRWLLDFCHCASHGSRPTSILTPCRKGNTEHTTGVLKAKWRRCGGGAP